MRMENYNHGIQVIVACLSGERDALVAWKMENDKLNGDAAAMRSNLLNLAIENLDELVIRPLMEAGYR